MDYQELTVKMEAIALEAGRYIVEERKLISGADVETKSQASLVTRVDKNSEKMIVDRLRRLIPEAGFVAEEGSAGEAGEDLVWIVDPLDGTTNYIHGVYPCSVSLALSEKGEIVAGVVYELGRDEMFTAWRGGRSLLNGREIATATSTRSVDTLIGTGFPYHAFDRVDDYIAAMRELMETTRGLRRMGSAAVDLCYVAAGRFDGFYEHALSPWDVAAGVLILRQAGGRVTDFNGGDNWLFGGEIIAASNSYFPEFYGIINKYLGHKS